jgi:hypothetical protein
VPAVYLSSNKAKGAAELVRRQLHGGLIDAKMIFLLEIICLWADNDPVIRICVLFAFLLFFLSRGENRESFSELSSSDHQIFTKGKRDWLVECMIRRWTTICYVDDSL